MKDEGMEQHVNRSCVCRMSSEVSGQGSGSGAGSMLLFGETRRPFEASACDFLDDPGFRACMITLEAL